MKIIKPSKYINTAFLVLHFKKINEVWMKQNEGDWCIDSIIYIKKVVINLSNSHFIISVEFSLMLVQAIITSLVMKNLYDNFVTIHPQCSLIHTIRHTLFSVVIREGCDKDTYSKNSSNVVESYSNIKQGHVLHMVHSLVQKTNSPKPLHF